MIGVNVPTQDEIAEAERANVVPWPDVNGWTPTPRGSNGLEYHRQVNDDVYAVTHQNSVGIWQLHVSERGVVEPRQHGFGEYADPADALRHADALIANPRYQPPHFLGNAGEDIEVTLRSQLDEHDRELSDRLKQSLEQSLDQSLNRGHHRGR